LLGSVYLPPGEGNHHYDPGAFACLLADTEAAAALGSVVLAGDFNARTAECADLSLASTDVRLLEPVSGAVPDSALLPPRRSPDQSTNPRGPALLSFCRSAGLALVNGRVPGNSASTPTSFGMGGDGASVVDYFLAPPSLFPLFSHLTVTLLDHTLTDHALLTLQVPRQLCPPPVPVSAARGPRRVRFLSPRDPAVWSRLREALSTSLVLGEPWWTTSSVDDHAAGVLSSVSAVLASLLRRARPPGLSPPRQPWATPSLRRLARAALDAAKAFHALPASSPARGRARSALQLARGVYRRAKSAAQRAWRSSRSAAFLGLVRSDPARFWRTIFRDQVVQPSAPLEDVAAHFEAVLNPPAAPIDPDSVAPLAPPADPPAPLLSLGAPISEVEVVQALESLKSGKAADEWGISAEVLKLLVSAPSPLCSLFNRFFSEGFPPSLGVSILIPVFKGKGDPGCLDNFRGISILPLLAKLYAVVLVRRLAPALEAAGLRADSQFGFRAGVGTLEAQFVLNACLDTAFSTRFRSSPRFAAFVDFSKAFDTVQRPLLWRLLRNLGVPEPFVVALASYYDSVSFRVELPSGLTDPIPARVGVKQGCPLSPVLFGVFIECLLRAFLDFGSWPAKVVQEFGFLSLGGRPVPPLFFADDLGLLSLSRRGLQLQLHRLRRFALLFGLRVNVAKTKAMAFHLTPKAYAQLLAAPLMFGAAGDEVPIEWVDEFKYLGLVLHRLTLFRRAPSVLLEAALTRYHALWRRCRAHGIEDVSSLSTLFDSLVTSVLGYGAPIWGPDVFAPKRAEAGLAPSSPLDDPPAGSVALGLERLQRRFMRAVLALPQRTAHLVLHLETRRPPLQLVFLAHTLRFYARLLSHPSDSLIGAALRASAAPHLCGGAAGRRSAGSWAHRFHDWVSSLGIPFSLPSSFPPIVSVGRQLRSSTTSAPPLPSDPSLSLSLAYRRWTDDLVIRAAADVRTAHLLSPNPPSPSPTWWCRRPPDFYSRFPSLSCRSLVTASRAHLPIHGLPLFGGDGRLLDPDPPSLPLLLSVAHCLSSTHPHMLSLRSILAAPIDLVTLLSSPPVCWPVYLATLSRYRRYVGSGVSIPTLHRLVPELGPPPPLS
jgi:hypothetical protein